MGVRPGFGCTPILQAVQLGAGVTRRRPASAADGRVRGIRRLVRHLLGADDVEQRAAGQPALALLCGVGAGAYADAWAAPASVRQMEVENIPPTQSRSERETYERRYRVYLALYRAQKEALAAGYEARPDRERVSPQVGVLNRDQECL